MLGCATSGDPAIQRSSYPAIQQTRGGSTLVLRQTTMSRSANSLPPWVHGPLELLRHADGHLKAAGDTDRRIALIGFDQAIEVTIEVYVRLHPRLRGNKQLQGEVVDKALRNFHTKIAFLEDHLASEGLDESLPFEAIVWYHSLRNELYHSGNGMVPELKVVLGAREAAVQVFAAVFGKECAAEFLPRQVDEIVDPASAVFPSADPAMAFLSQFLEVERRARAVLGETETAGARGLQSLWKRVQERDDRLEAAASMVDFAVQLRDRLVRGGVGSGITEDDLSNGLRCLQILQSALMVPPLVSRKGSQATRDIR